MALAAVAVAGAILSSPALAADEAKTRKPSPPAAPYRSCFPVVAEEAVDLSPAAPEPYGCVAAEEASPRQRMFSGWTMYGAPDGGCWMVFIAEPGLTQGRIQVRDLCTAPSLLDGAVSWRLEGSRLTLSGPDGVTALEMESISQLGFKGGGQILVRSIQMVPPLKGPGYYGLRLVGEIDDCHVNLDGRDLGSGWAARPDADCIARFGFNKGTELWAERPYGTMVMGREGLVTFPLVEDGSVTGKTRDGREVIVTKYWSLAVPLPAAQMSGKWSFQLERKGKPQHVCVSALTQAEQSGVKPLDFGGCRLPDLDIVGWRLDAAGYMALHDRKGAVAVLLWPTTDGFEGRHRGRDLYVAQQIP